MTGDNTNIRMNKGKIRKVKQQTNMLVQAATTKQAGKRCN